VRDIRAGIPGITLRTTFIVGFPGETDADFAELLGFIRETRFERLGVFKYSQEEGTRAAKRDDQLTARVKDRRWNEAMALQREISTSVCREQVGRTLKVLVEEPGIARGEGDAPDIDGRVYLDASIPVGGFAEVRITDSTDYDLLALPPGVMPTGFKVAKQAQ